LEPNQTLAPASDAKTVCDLFDEAVATKKDRSLTAKTEDATNEFVWRITQRAEELDFAVGDWISAWEIPQGYSGSAIELEETEDRRINYTIFWHETDAGLLELGYKTDRTGYPYLWVHMEFEIPRVDLEQNDIYAQWQFEILDPETEEISSFTCTSFGYDFTTGAP
jgi:hypothetical protein